jgi:hypothetical protein
MENQTLEEASEKYLQEWRLVNNIHLSNPIHAERCKNDFKAGAKWQAKRMYSEEEVYNLLCSMPNFYNMTIPQQVKARDKWFEQFKKK